MSSARDANGLEVAAPPPWERRRHTPSPLSGDNEGQASIGETVQASMRNGGRWALRQRRCWMLMMLRALR